MLRRGVAALDGGSVIGCAPRLAAQHLRGACGYNRPMRYRETTQPGQPAAGVSPGMMAGTAGYTLLLGIAFVLFGLRGRQRWIAFWGATMVIAGVAYMLATALS